MARAVFGGACLFSIYCQHLIVSGQKGRLAIQKPNTKGCDQ